MFIIFNLKHINKAENITIGLFFLLFTAAIVFPWCFLIYQQLFWDTNISPSEITNKSEDYMSKTSDSVGPTLKNVTITGFDKGIVTHNVPLNLIDTRITGNKIGIVNEK